MGETPNATRRVGGHLENEVSEVEKQNPVPLDYAADSTQRRSRYHLVIWIILAGLAGVFAVEWFASTHSLIKTRAAHNREKCGSNLKQIDQALRVYANAHQGRLPDTLGQLMEVGVSSMIFVCPASNDEAAVVGTTTQESIDHVEMRGHLSYIYLGKGMSNTGRADVALAYEPIADHSYAHAGMNVLFEDGHVEWFMANSF